jgi:DNA primase
LITAFENGVRNVIAPQGTAFTDRQARILKRYVDEVVLCFDSDAAGEKAAERSLPHLLGESLLIRVAEMPPGEDPDSLIQKHGGEAFAEQIAKSRDFFEFQIERQARMPDFHTARGKVAAARKLADFISLIADSVTREAVVNNAARRLEMGAPELRAMLKKKSDLPKTESDEALEVRTVEPIILDESRQWLLLLSMRHAVSRMWLQAQSWDRVLDDGTAGSALLYAVLNADFRPDEPASVSAFLSTLPAEQEAALVPILARPLPGEPKILAEDCWHELERREVAKRRQAIEARLRAPGLSAEEQTRLHQQIIEIHQEAARIPAPRPPKLTM